MGEVDQEQRHVCRICSKICVSGKSLGGHMRVHLAQISASRKAAAAAAQEKSEIKVECDDDDADNDQESCMMKQCEEGNVELGDGDDQSSSYELRENPKKSWKFSDPKHGLMLNSNSCKECGKEFASLRALSGHMRCHSIKSKKELHLCRECGRGFNSMRAMFGHMKSHSKRVKKASAAAAVESESLSDLENSFCPIRRKRSRIRYKGTVNPSFSGGDNASNSAVSELEEAEEAAMCLVMLSRGVGRSCLKLDSNAELSEDDSAYFGGGAIVASCGSKRFCGSGGGFLIDDEKKLENVSEFDELGLKFVTADQTKFDLDLDLDHDQASVGEFLESGFGKNGSENEDDLDLEMMEDFFEKRPKYKHNKMVGVSSKLSMNASLLSANQADPKHDQESGSVVVRLSLESSKCKERECPICFKVFTSGQALGGHKRAHYNGVVESKNRGAAEAREMLDLNFPISGDAGATASLGLSSWFAERSREHEALVLTT